VPDKSPAQPVRRSAETIAFLALRPLGLHQLNYHMELLRNRNFRLKPAFAKHEPPKGEQHDVLPKDGQTEERRK
jgi:hypothetical protein